MDNSMMLGPKGLIKRCEFVRILIQSLYSLGYKNSASLLESESGISFISNESTLLKSQILDSKYEDCIHTLNLIEDLVEETRNSASFLVFQQLFFELLSSGDDFSALNVLRKRISPLGMSKEKVQKLACGIVSMREIGLGGKNDVSIDELRRNLVIELEGLLPPPITVPPRRLEYLVEMALTFQLDSCLYHNSPDEISLYEDHCCGRNQIPTETAQILYHHKNEVWFVQFSNNGEYLASSSSDCTAIIWMVSEEGCVSLKHTLSSHRSPVSFVAWSPDDTMLLTCGNGEVLKLWDVESGTCKHTFGGEQSPVVSSCAWFPDSKRLVCGSGEPDRCIYMWDLKGKELDAWRGVRIPKVSDLSVTPDGERLICICSDKDIRIFNLRTKTEWVISEDHSITSLSVSRDGKFLIVNLNSQEIHMWDVTGTWDAPLKYTGHKQGKYVIRSCFGGLNCAFIASGSENSQIYIWHRKSCKLLEVLRGHSMTVNCVSWNPTKPQMLASASDDHTIRIWGPSGELA
ncbi:transducin family protein / WD-40 repeat family protein isoform X2 [Tasmannia lanceolata]|uniref:transducin family protein / WD-40 repeat family protein isoform X2 n=1 Tax=Tasmannia lanceolata TaxID=3420 RepID=UPI0040634C88